MSFAPAEPQPLDPAWLVRQTAVMIRASKIALRPVEEGDVGLLTSWWNDPEFLDGGDYHWPTRAREIEERIAKKPNHQKRAEFMIVLAGVPDERPVGHISMGRPFRFRSLRCLEIGFGIHPDHRRHGYATQAARLLIDRIFGAERVYRVQAHCRVANVASRLVLERAGMTFEGTLRGLAYHGGRYEDVHIFSILRPEWSDSAGWVEAVSRPPGDRGTDPRLDGTEPRP